VVGKNTMETLLIEYIFWLAVFLSVSTYIFIIYFGITLSKQLKKLNETRWKLLGSPYGAITLSGKGTLLFSEYILTGEYRGSNDRDILSLGSNIMTLYKIYCISKYVGSAFLIFLAFSSDEIINLITGMIGN